MRIRLVWEGKTKNPELRALEADYTARIGHFGELVVEELNPRAGDERGKRGQTGGKLSPAERRLQEKVAGSTRVMLDAGGREWTSQEFADWLGGQAVGGAREICFLVGGPDGFSSAFKKQADLLLSLSRLTLTHDWARVLLLEQIYRAFTILRGYPYSR